MSENQQVLFDANGTRFTLVKEVPGKSDNWLFVPGGPGAGSVYFNTLVSQLELPGKYWLVDMPYNGGYVDEDQTPEDYDFEQWLTCFSDLTSFLPDTILVGHSCGGMFALLTPALETQLKGLVIMNSAPTLWLESAVGMAKERKLPDLSDCMTAFVAEPNPHTFRLALRACADYYFAPENVAQHIPMLESLPFNYRAAVWWQRKSLEMSYKAAWIPQKLPTLILGADDDCITPFTLFEEDARFRRDNVLLRRIHTAGHFPWYEQPEAVGQAYQDFYRLLQAR